MYVVLAVLEYEILIVEVYDILLVTLFVWVPLKYNLLLVVGCIV